MQSNNGSDPQNQSQQNHAVAAAAAQQQWMAMQYPAMVMPPQMMHYPPQYMPYHHHQYHHQFHPQQQQHQQQQPGSNGENKTIWIGDLQNWMDEDYLHSCFASTGEVATIKLIKILQNYTGKAMPNTELPFRLNWATFSMGDKRSNNVSDLSIFVGDLASDVTDSLLHETFASKYPSVKAAKVVIDVNTGCSKGYGFVRPMRIGAATPRKSSGYQQQYSSQGGYVSSGASPQGSQSDGDYTNTTIFVGGLGPNVKDEDLRQPFSQYGEIVSVKIPVRRGCGFVQFANRNNAEEALQKLNGTTIADQTQRADFGNSLSGAYYGGQIYDGFGYAVPQPHDPSMYAAAAAAYGAYPVYGTHQQQLSWSVEFYDPSKCGVELNFDYTK
ncbi:RNA-binding protein 47C' [Actinidia rufa]|uniref:RNA-binding protein 47C n=1 Tax=Actinidia rufa TaxID=165716 RepID=A0A7J0E0U2_9ERIC|nr:RNA-binding protein 47C' [Actinidia rufa]